MTINDLLRTLVAELEAGEVPDPLGQEFTLSLIWCDLARLAGETPPADVLAAADDSSFLPIPPLVPSVVPSVDYGYELAYEPAD